MLVDAVFIIALGVGIAAPIMYEEWHNSKW